MTDQGKPEGGATPSIGANPSFAQAKAEAQVAEAKPKEGAADSQPAAVDQGEKSEPKADGRDLKIKELTRRLRQQERANERLLREYENRERKPAETPAPQQPTGRKTLKDFGYNEADYLEYERNELRAEAEKAVREEAEKTRTAEMAATRAERFQERIAKFAETHADFDEVVYEGKWPCPPVMAEAIEDADEGPAIAYHLAQNPNVAAQIARLSAVQIGREIQKLEDRLVSERKKAAEPQISKAPPPPPKIEGGDPGNVESSPLKMSEDQLKNWSDAKFRKWREGSMARRR